MTTELGSRDRKARRLTDVSRALTYARSLQEVLDLSIECAVDLLDASRAVLMLKDAEGLLRIHAARGIDAPRSDAFREALDESLLSRLSDLLGPDAREHFLGVPLVVQGAVIGLLGVRRNAATPATEEDEWLLSALADQASIAVDNARRQEAQEDLMGRVGELERLHLDKDRAFQILSHDLRSPLTAIQGYGSLLIGEILGPINERQREALDRIKIVGNHLESILANVLEMARLSSSPIDVHRVHVNIHAVVHEAVHIVLPAAREAGIDFDVRGDEASTMVTDGDRLRQVLVHLLDNAIKYTPGSGAVVVEWRTLELQGRRWAEIGVIDRGPGIPAEHQSAIFEPYIRGDGSVERSRTGAGLGLAIARSIVQRLGGSLTLDSAVGKGSTFRVRLPPEIPS